MNTPKKKLFTPKGLSNDSDNRYLKLNQEQPIKDGIRINQYDYKGNKQGYWEEYSDGQLKYKGFYVNNQMDGIWEWYYINGNLEFKGSYINGERDGIWEKYYYNGNLYSKGSFKNGEMDGIWELYYSNGQLESKGLYKDGEMDGIWELYYSNGQLESKGLYKDGERDGIWESYWDNGELYSKGNYVNGKRDGYWESYYPNNQLESKGSYKNGLKDGLWEEYWIDGELNFKELYKDGKLIKSLKESEQPKKGKLFTPKGLSNDENNRYLKLNQEQPIKDGIRINQYDYKGNKQGYWEEYFPNGQLNYKGSFKNGERDGIWEKYFDNGQLNYKGSFKNGKQDGIWEEYFDDGNLYCKGSFKNGLRDGIWEWYYDIGNLYSKGSYKNGEVDGIWEKYYENGQLESKGSYKNGEKEGYWEFFHENGSLYTKYLYKDGKLIKSLKESEQPKKGKLFIPRKITGEDSRYIQWNKEQPIKDGKRINQYDLTTADMTGRWGEGDMNGGDTINLFEIYWDVFSDDYYLEDGKLSEKENVFNDLKDRILSNLIWDIGEDGPLGHMHFDLTIPLRSKKVRDKFEELYNERQPLKESEQPKKKLFIPRNLDSKYKEWNEEQPIIDGARINQYNSNGKKDGLWIEYWNGFLSSKIMWKNGEQNGIYQTFHLNGQIQYDGMTKDGNFHGVWKMYYQNSGLREICNYENDRLVGVKKWFHPSGQLNLIANYIDGKVDGLSITYNFDGTIHRKDVYSMAKKIAYIVYDEDGSVRESMDWKDGYDNIIIKEQMENKDKILKSFEPQKELNPKVWDEDGKLKKKIKDTLVAIGQEFHKTLEVEAPIDDIIFTGSLANYNWSQYSDVDLHVLMDFNEFDDKELIKKYFDAKKAVWNDNHDIKIKGYDVELYAQDKDEPHESTGIYSVMNDEWVKKPKPQDVKIDRETIKKKVKQFEREYNRILELYNEEKYEETRKALDKIKDKIKKYRKAGLDKGGEMATENLVFKTMRRSGLMEKIYDLGLETTDKQYTIETLGESKNNLFWFNKLFNNK